MSPNVIPLRGPAQSPSLNALLAEYRAACADLEARWPDVGVEDLRRVVAAFDAFREAMR